MMEVLSSLCCHQRLSVPATVGDAAADSLALQPSPPMPAAPLMTSPPLSVVGAGAAALTLRSGDVIPRLGLGTWLKKDPADQAKCAEAVRLAVGKYGYRHIDTAEIYETHKYVAEGLRKSGVPRKDVWVTSKIWNANQAFEAAQKSIDRCLAELELDYLDLILIHWPCAFDPETREPVVDAATGEARPVFLEAWRAMLEARAAGKVRNVGVSNFGPEALKKLCAAFPDKKDWPVMDQVERHPYLQQRELAAVAREMGVVLTSYSPFGNLNKMMGTDQPLLVDDPVIGRIAKAHATLPQSVVLAWHLQATDACFIPKAVGEAHIKSNTEIVKLDQAEIDEINKLDRGTRYCVPSWKVAKLFD